MNSTHCTTEEFTNKHTNLRGDKNSQKVVEQTVYLDMGVQIFHFHCLRLRKWVRSCVRLGLGCWKSSFI